MLFSMTINTVVQLAVFMIVPFLWWLFTARKKQNFFRWIGIYKPKVLNKCHVFVLSGITLLLLLLPGMYLLYTFEDKSMLAGAKFSNTGFEGLIAILIFAFIQTGLAEEILFRGFLNKRLSKKFGFVIGNSIQAILFGIIHGVMLFSVVTPITVILVILFTFLAGYLMGYIDEKVADGSIIPSWIIHGLLNLISSLVFWVGFIQIGI